MVSVSRVLPFTMATLLAVIVQPLHAQLNPKWQTINSPDFLNLYQQSNAKTLKPEIVTVFDFSGSMQSIMYHSNLHNTDTNDGWGSSTMSFTLTQSGTSPNFRYNCTASLSSGYTLTGGVLVRPDGTTLVGGGASPDNADQIINTNYSIHSPALPGENATTKAADVRNWIRSASHARFTYTVGTDSRTIDIPIGWTILDRLDINSINSAMTMYNTYPLKMTIKDPVSNTEVELDSRYKNTASPNAIIASTATWSIGGQTLSRTARINLFEYRSNYTQWLFNGKYQNTDATRADYNTTYAGKYIVPDAVNGSLSATGSAAKAFTNGIPARSRTQGVKDAALRVWVKYYDKVYWAFRFLNNSGSNQEGAAPGNLSSDTKNYLPAAAPTEPPSIWRIGGTQRGWLLMNNHSLDGMRHIAAYTDDGATPLNTALANAYAQFNDPDSVFNEVEIPPDDTPQECMKHFVILFTDGQPNTETGNTPTSTASPYISAMTGNAQMGNAVFAANKAEINPRTTNSYFNILNLSALAAHGGDSTQTSWIPTPTYPGDTTYPAGRQLASEFLPFWISGRNGTSFSPSHPIQTMTVGVSLSGAYNSTGSPKYRMFAAACLGDPALKTWNLNTLTPFALSDPGNPASAKDPNSVYFFDAADPQTLATYLDKAFEASTALSQTNATTAPVLPTVGTGLGAAVYLTKFVPPKEGGPVWPGDLLMYPIREDSNGITRLLDASGNALTGSDLADPDKARWAASKILTSMRWYNRTIYTRKAATSSDPTPSMLKVTVSASDTAATISDAGYTAIKPTLPGSTDSDKFDNWRYFIGAAMPVTVTPPATRSNIMGDIVNSTPAVLDYSTLPPTVASKSSTLNAAWTAHASDNRMFRVIFVGTNQGLFHAFGEVSWDETVAGGKIQNGVADELWAFAPTDLLPYIHYYRNSGNTHRFGVDGSPSVYLLDLPASNAVRGNGVFDVDSTRERAVVVFGLGKGGRSYYGIDVRDPANPVFQENNATYGVGMGWSLCPDEPYNYQAGRFKSPATSASLPVVTRMGLSTSVPTFARVVATPSKLIKDVVLLGGGYSVPEIESNLPAAPAAAPNTGTLLGRSVIALDAKGGGILGVWDMTSETGVGPVAMGVVPHTFFRGSGFHQRAYFADHWGGIWALGSSSLSGISLRTDTSYLDAWSSSPRPVFRLDPTDGLISSLPVPFAVPNMPLRTSSPFVTPAAVGVAFVTGDRNNPLDEFYTTAWSKPFRHRLNVLFDRQDSYLLGLDSDGMATSDLADASNYTATSPQLNPQDSSFYLKTKYGYYVNFPDRTTTTGGQWVPKGIFSPLLLGGRLFYSYFNPTLADPCTGGTGETHTFRINNVMLPDTTDSDAVDPYHSGKVLVWSGVSSPFAIRSLVSGLQAGMSGGSGTNNNPNAPQNLQMQSLGTGSSDIYPKPRVWRTVQ